MNRNFPFSIFFWIEQVSPLAVFFVLFFLGLLIYFNAIFYPFVHDELVFILKNPFIADLNLKNIFLPPSLDSNGPWFVHTYYRPLLELFNRLLFQVFHFNPRGYHLVNILVHILNSFLVYQIARILTEKRKTLSLALAVLFLIHPIQSEAVACVSGISNLLFGFFCLLSFILYLSSCRQKSLSLYALSLFLSFVSLFVKEQAVIFPFLILLYEICLGSSRVPWNKRLGPAAGFFIILIGYFFIRTAIIGFPIMEMGGRDPELWLRLRSIPGSLLMYLGLIFFPRDLHYYRSVDMLAPFILPAVIFAAILLGIILLIFLARDQRGFLIFGAGWFFLSQAPTLNIIPIVNEYSFLLAAEHFMYFPLVGILFFIGGIGLYLYSLIKKEKREMIYAWGGLLFVCASLIFMVITIKQNMYWHSDIALFERTLQFEKNFGRGHLLLAKAYAADDQWEKALSEYTQALSIMRGYMAKIKNEQIRPFYQNYLNEIYAGMAYSYQRLRGPTDAP